MLESVYSLDDVDLAQLTSPARPLHRRARSDPSSEIDWARLRAERGDGPLMHVDFDDLDGAADLAIAGSPVRARAPDADAAVFKRALSPMANGTGYSPAIKKHLSVSDMPLMTIAEGGGGGDTRPPSSNSSVSDDSSALEPARAGGALPKPETLGLVPLPLGEPCHLKKEPNYNKKDVPMWTVEEDLLILQLVEQVRRRPRAPARPHARAPRPSPLKGGPNTPLKKACTRPPLPSSPRITVLEVPRLSAGSRLGSCARSTASGGRRSRRICRGGRTTACATVGIAWSARS